MKVLVQIFLALIFVVPAFSQSSQLAKSDQQYTSMYRNKKYKMARTHAEFYAQAKENKILSRYFKDRKFALSFLKKMEFSSDGLKTIDLKVNNKQFEAEVGKVLGFEPRFWSAKGKGYCCESRECTPCSVHSKCLKSCEKKSLTGSAYDPATVLGSGY
ncbi:MAG: hypothetical protein AAFO07_30465 [Bacteroidota bacterium]